MSAQEIVSRGPRAAETRLLAEISRHTGEARRDPALLARPVRVVVPSRSLRDHLARALVRSAGAVAGVSIHTLYGLALEVLERSGGEVPRGDALFPILVRRAARREPPLRERFDSLAQGYGVVEAAVADLLDAGFDASHQAPVHELLAERCEAGQPIEIAAAVVRCASHTLQSMHRLGVGHRSLVLRWACTLIEQHAPVALPSRAVLIHGFADATGTASDLLAALVSQCDATVLFDAPPDPGDPAKALAAGSRFSARLRARLHGLVPIADGQEPLIAEEQIPPVAEEQIPPIADGQEPVSLESAAQGRGARADAELELLAAPGASAEVRAVALRVRAAIDAGSSPESIALVAREPGDYALPIRVHFARLAIPFSGSGPTGPQGRGARRIAALSSLLRSGPEAELDDWLDALGSGFAAAEQRPAAKALADLRDATRVLGLRELGDLAAQEPPSAPISLPFRLGLRVEAPAEPYAPHAKLDSGPLRRLIERARETCRYWRELQSGPEQPLLCDQLARIRALLAGPLGWDESNEREARLFTRLARLAAELPAGMRASRDELCALLEKQLQGAAEEAIGGRGGGVQVLGVMEARSRCFEQLFVLGLNRDVFPRPVHEDPLLPDSLRQSLCVLLPELPIKRRGYDEERHLFAQLLAASPRVTLSWQYTSDEGRERAASTLVERLCWARPDLRVLRAPGLQACPPAEDDLERPAWEHAIVAGLYGTGPQQRTSLEAALRERSAGIAGASPGGLAADSVIGALADGKLSVLREMDRPVGSPAALGPYFGFVGPVRSPADLRNRTPFVTSLERNATCGWRFLLEGLLKLEAPLDPGASLPEVAATDLGAVVHEVLERIVADARPSRTEEVGWRAAWPSEQRLAQLLRDAASARLAEAAIDSPVLVEVLCRVALPLLDRARQLDWSDGPLRVLDVESAGEVVIPRIDANAELPPQRIRFIADRVEPGHRQGDGPLLTDYKTGAPLSKAVKPETRRKHLLDAVRSGRNLQAVAYACSRDGQAAAGRYLQLAVEDDDAVAASVSGSDAKFVAAFHASARALLGAWESGCFAPQLTSPKRGSSPCQFCSVKQACSRGDTAARRRMLAWESEVASADTQPPGTEASLREVWRMRRGELEARPSAGNQEPPGNQEPSA